MIKKRGDAILFLGVGGTGMAPLALYLSQCGHQITGYDDDPRVNVVRMLESGGVEILDRETIPPGTSSVVYSNAVGADHPLLRTARESGLELVRRGEMLARSTAEKRVCAVVGSHGKTTTAAMLVETLEQNRFPCDYVVGGLFTGGARLPARARESAWVVVEVDESDGTIAGFRPHLSLLVNSDWDHVDFYPEPEALASTFEALLKRTRGVVLIPDTSECADRLSDAGPTRILTFGGKGAYRGRIVRDSGEEIELTLGGRFPPGNVVVRATGAFNGNNAIAALSAAHIMCGNLHKGSLRAFRGVERRQTRLFSSPSLAVIEDYAHHPVEIRALLASVRSTHRGHRLVVIFQPHRYSRTRQFKRELAEALSRADRLFLLDIYPACERTLAGGGLNDLLGCFDDKVDVSTLTNVDELSVAWEDGSSRPSLVVFVGAGDIDRWAASFVRSLRSRVEVAERGSGVDGSTFRHRVAGRLHAETKLIEGESLAEKTTLRVGGRAGYYCEPASVGDLQVLLKSARKHGLPIFFLGRGSNLIVPDEGFEGLVIRLHHPFWREIRLLEDGRFQAGAGTRLKQICGEACRLGLTGFEFMEGIPGTLGGSLRMNAGAMGGWMFDIVREVEFMTPEGDLMTLQREAFHVGYRECRELREAFATRAVLQPVDRDSSQAIRERIQAYSQKRRASQPPEPNSGCIFRNPNGGYAGQLIDELGLKGRSVGAAEVSSVHGNFIINRGGATSREVIALIRSVRDEVKLHKGIQLEPEVLLMGRSWDQVL